ncbi:hypothetical protein D3C73_1401580 [compost metagenome]
MLGAMVLEQPLHYRGLRDGPQIDEQENQFDSAFYEVVQNVVIKCILEQIIFNKDRDKGKDQLAEKKR